jgi:fructose-1,6-bisphosphatase I
MVATAGFKGLHGYTGSKNIHGEEVKQIDQEADDVLVELLGSSDHFGLLVSEERDSVISSQTPRDGGKYVIAFDPLDGSSNIGSNIPTGTIFCIFKRRDLSKPASADDFCQASSAIVAAGYAVYGAKTSFVYAARSGVHGFTLDPSIGEFVLTEEHIRIPERGAIFSINEGNTCWWEDGTKRFIEQLKSSNRDAAQPYTARYVGSLVADFDRTIRRGGIFLYPTDAKRPKGRLRLLYECLPLAYIIEQAGGSATNGVERLINVVPRDIHERSAFIAGGSYEMEWYERVTRSKAR